MAKTWGRYIKRQAKRVFRAAKKRYVTKSGAGLRIGKIMSDVKYLKDMVNAEKKRVVGFVQGQLVGQTSANANGFYASDITPIASVGTGYTQRTGASIKLHSSYMRIGVSQNTAQSIGVKGRIVIVQVKGNTVSNPTSYAQQIWNPNAFVTGGTLTDYNSQFNPDYFGTYRILRTKKFSLSMDQISTQNTILNFGLGMKYNRGQGHHIRYQNNTDTVVDGQILMFVFADNGNISSTTASTLTGVATTAVNTGLNFSYNLTHYYYDN